MTAPGVVVDEQSPVPITASKVVLADHDLPSLPEVEAWFAESHAAGRAVAVHAVTADALALAIAAWHAAGVLAGDRIEHAAMAPGPAVDVMAGLGVRVVTQPGMVATRGDSYLDDVPTTEHRDLWRCGSLIAAGIPTAAGSDAPHGPLDPWCGIAATVDRRTPSGRVLGPDERIDARRALRLLAVSARRSWWPGSHGRRGHPRRPVRARGPARRRVAAPRRESGRGHDHRWRGRPLALSGATIRVPADPRRDAPHSGALQNSGTGSSRRGWRRPPPAVLAGRRGRVGDFATGCRDGHRHRVVT